MPSIHQVIFAGGLEPIASQSTSYPRSEDNGWLGNIISTDNGRTDNKQFIRFMV